MADRPPPADDPAAIDGTALWRWVTASVRPLRGRRVAPSVPAPGTADPVPIRRPDAPPPPPRSARASPSPAATLDATWDRRLAHGMVSPDAVIDLHGHTLAAAHAALDRGLARAIARGARLVLLVAGRAPAAGHSRLDDPLRGRIRASVEDWLHASPHRAGIAALRPAHPRHGGAGALYVVLRRRR